MSDFSKKTDIFIYFFAVAADVICVPSLVIPYGFVSLFAGF